MSVTAVVRDPSELAQLLVWAHNHEYKCHITHNVPSSGDFIGDMPVLPWFSVELVDVSKRGQELEAILNRLVGS